MLGLRVINVPGETDPKLESYLAGHPNVIHVRSAADLNEVLAGADASESVDVVYAGGHGSSGGDRLGGIGYAEVRASLPEGSRVFFFTCSLGRHRADWAKAHGLEPSAVRALSGASFSRSSHHQVRAILDGGRSTDHAWRIHVLACALGTILDWIPLGRRTLREVLTNTRA